MDVSELCDSAEGRLTFSCCGIANSLSCMNVSVNKMYMLCMALEPGTYHS